MESYILTVPWLRRSYYRRYDDISAFLTEGRYARTVFRKNSASFTSSTWRDIKICLWNDTRHRMWRKTGCMSQNCRILENPSRRGHSKCPCNQLDLCNADQLVESQSIATSMSNTTAYLAMISLNNRFVRPILLNLKLSIRIMCHQDLTSSIFYFSLRPGPNSPNSIMWLHESILQHKNYTRTTKIATNKLSEAESSTSVIRQEGVCWSETGAITHEKKNFARKSLKQVSKSGWSKVIT